MENGRIMLTADDGSEEAFFVLEKAEIAGQKYLLVADSDDENANALILKQVEENETLTFDVLEDDKEINIIAKYFEELLEDVDLELE
jgi:hypothetical protein